MREYPLNISAEVEYARRWAFSRNPSFYDFNDLGGDCTNFVSQCIYAGGAVMNYTRDVGWYYVSLNDRAAAWTGVEYFYRFITKNRGAGPFGEEVHISKSAVGDVIQLGGSAGFYHSLLVTSLCGEPCVAAHSFDAFDRPLSSYSFEKLRCIHIIGARKCCSQ
ncbi:amidase domain-containing protein [Ruminococcus albus]|uniref:Putative amidase domain-containing protein n=1 Tax=Ruminococcus albus TaxID=1264 RepID=A0A1H7GP94_RUMAL|nr:amidase domain-containing protein [Ruminococcus albus]SEK39879.1 Putative amidase domain-containing protein [Ruminococcus albus]